MIKYAENNQYKVCLLEQHKSNFYVMAKKIFFVCGGVLEGRMPLETLTEKWNENFNDENYRFFILPKSDADIPAGFAEIDLSLAESYLD